MMRAAGKVMRCVGLAGAIVFADGCGKDTDGVVSPNSVTGTWAGTTSQERDIEFVVEGGNVAQGSFSFNLQGSGCNDATGGVVIQGGASVPIQDGEFSFPRTQIGQNAFLTAEGRFESSTNASGSFEVEDGACEVHITWTATKQ